VEELVLPRNRVDHNNGGGGGKRRDIDREKAPPCGGTKAETTTTGHHCDRDDDDDMDRVVAPAAVKGEQPKPCRAAARHNCQTALHPPMATRTRFATLFIWKREREIPTHTRALLPAANDD
jgi:hypothetical protein